MDLCFYIRRCDAVNKGGQTSIYCTITINGTPAVPFSTGIKITASKWLPKRKTTSDETADTVRREINNIENLLRKIKVDLQETEKIITANAIKEKFMILRNGATTRKKKSETVLFLDMAKMYIDKKVKMGASDRTRKNNTTFLNNIKQYLQEQKIKNLTPSKIDYEFIEDFTMKFQFEQKNSKNYTNCHIGFISAVLDLCVLKKVIKHNSMTSLKLNYEDNFDNKGLTIKEIETLQNAQELRENEQKAVDIFLFLCGSGCDYCDYIKITAENFISRKGTLMLNYERQKTITYNTNNSNIANPILKDCAIKIVEKYGQNNLPKIKYLQDVNSTLQAVAVRLGIKTKLTTKRGRKTFSNLSVNREMHTDEQTAYQLGHSSTKQLKHYRAYDYEILSNLLG